MILDLPNKAIIAWVDLLFGQTGWYNDRQKAIQDIRDIYQQAKCPKDLRDIILTKTHDEDELIVCFGQDYTPTLDDFEYILRFNRRLQYFQIYFLDKLPLTDELLNRLSQIDRDIWRSLLPALRQRGVDLWRIIQSWMKNLATYDFVARMEIADVKDLTSEQIEQILPFFIADAKNYDDMQEMIAKLSRKSRTNLLLQHVFDLDDQIQLALTIKTPSASDALKIYEALTGNESVTRLLLANHDRFKQLIIRLAIICPAVPMPPDIVEGQRGYLPANCSICFTAPGRIFYLCCPSGDAKMPDPLLYKDTDHVLCVKCQETRKSKICPLCQTDTLKLLECTSLKRKVIEYDVNDQRQVYKKVQVSLNNIH